MSDDDKPADPLPKDKTMPDKTDNQKKCPGPDMPETFRFRDWALI